MNAAAVAAGARAPPAAAKSLTSPAPVAPNRWPGSISPKPMAMPAIEPAIVNRPMPATANAPPAAAARRRGGAGRGQRRREQVRHTARAHVDRGGGEPAAGDGREHDQV